MENSTGNHSKKQDVAAIEPSLEGWIKGDIFIVMAKRAQQGLMPGIALQI